MTSMHKKNLIPSNLLNFWSFRAFLTGKVENIIHGKNDFADLKFCWYRSENNFVRPSK